MRYSDAEIERAILDLRSGGEPIDEDALARLSDAQLRRYRDALEREEFAVACRLRRSFLAGPFGLDPPPWPVFAYPPVVPDDAAELR